MTLSFSQEINGWQTKFPEKIWYGFLIEELALKPKELLIDYYWNSVNRMDVDMCYPSSIDMKTQHPPLFPKIHTIRTDVSNRWKVGNKIHFVINNRRPNRYQFAPVIKVRCVQKIKIKWINLEGDEKFISTPIMDTPIMDNLRFFAVQIEIDEEPFYHLLVSKNENSSLRIQDYLHSLKKSDEFLDFTRNDGFDTSEQFLEYFSEDFEGKIIHWTDKKY